MPIHGYPGNIITANPTAPTVSAASGVWTTEQQLQAVSQGNWPGYEYPISRSLRFNSADTPYLNRTPASAGNRKTWTWSGWIKRSSTTQTYEGIFQAGTSTSAQGLAIGDSTTANIIAFYYTNNDLALRSTQVLRDVSAWYHIVVALDTTQATASNRLRIYLNGSEITTWTTDNRATAFSQNSDQSINNNIQHIIGNYSGSISSSYSPNGYMTEINFIDGQALTPSSFGLNDPETGIWSPKQYTGTYGTNGFYLNFSDNSNTTAATLGKDSSGNGNNWTPNNFSVTAGAGNDSLVDTPTSYGTDTGVGGEVRGNYCTLNPLQTSNLPSPTITVADGNLKVTFGNTTQNGICNSTIFPQSGQFYCEATLTTVGGSFPFAGLIPVTANVNGAANSSIASFSSNWIGNGTLAANDVVGMAFDATNGTLQFYKNGAASGSQITGITGLWCFAVSGLNGCVWQVNFGQRPFAYTAPSGFKALCTQNLPTPTIGATSTTQAGKYFNPVLYSGNSSTQNITGVGFAPDFTWLKVRNDAQNHRQFDTVRGANQRLMSSSTAAEATTTNELTAFGSDGFTLGANTDVNGTGFNYVSWNWNAGGSNATNTSGTITSTVRANTTAGFSIVTYTGNGGSNSSIGHGLGVAPSMIITKGRSGAAVNNWLTWHGTFGVSSYIALNLTSAVNYAGATTTVYGGSSVTAPNSTTYTIGVDLNTNTATYVAYCFAAVAGYSAFGSYTGNGSTDGPFVYTGFRPRWLLIKNSSRAVAWWVVDTARNTSNVVGWILQPNVSTADVDSPVLDILSNGFKVRTTDQAANFSGETIIYAAFAESPFKYALAR